MWMNFAQDATAKIEGLTSGKSRFLQEADCAKVAADAAAELLEVASRHTFPKPVRFLRLFCLFYPCA